VRRPPKTALLRVVRPSVCNVELEETAKFVPYLMNSVAGVTINRTGR